MYLDLLTVGVWEVEVVFCLVGGWEVEAAFLAPGLVSVSLVSQTKGALETSQCQFVDWVHRPKWVDH